MSTKPILFLLLVLLLAACSPGGQSGPTATVPPSPTPLPPAATAVSETPVVDAVETTEIPQPVTAPVRTFQLIPEGSKVLYRVEEEFFSGAVERLGKELGLNTAVGWSRTMEGELQLQQEAGGQVVIVGGWFNVDLRTLKSDDDKRDQRIREQYLESNTFPTAAFVITGAEGLPAVYEEGQEVTFQLVGEMTIREITQEVVFEVTAVLDGDTITGTAFTEIMMVDYGFEPPEILGFLKALDPARIEVELTAVSG